MISIDPSSELKLSIDIFILFSGTYIVKKYRNIRKRQTLCLYPVSLQSLRDIFVKANVTLFIKLSFLTFLLLWTELRLNRYASFTEHLRILGDCVKTKVLK